MTNRIVMKFTEQYDICILRSFQELAVSCFLSFRIEQLVGRLVRPEREAHKQHGCQQWNVFHKRCIEVIENRITFKSICKTMRNLRIILLAASLWMVVTDLSAQTSNDLELLRLTRFEDSTYNKREVKFLLSDKKKNALVKYNPVTLTLGALMYAYQTTVSQQLHSDCPYQISCSNFSHRSISEHGLLKGICLSADRLMRCNPPSVGEASPVRIDQNNRVIDDPKQYHFH